MNARGAASGLLLAVLLGSGTPAAGAGNPPSVDFVLNCQGCHLPGGMGMPGRVPRLAGHVATFLRSSEGRAYLMRVPGVAQSPLSDARLAAVLNWMLHAFDAADIPPGFEPYDAAEVGYWRHHILRDVSVVRAQVLADIARRGGAGEAAAPSPPGVSAAGANRNYVILNQ